MLANLFIDAKWHTVPLKGELKRTESGKKTEPVFEKDYRDKYTKVFNTKGTLVAGAITGKVSNIVAVDCDNQDTYDIFKSLDPDYAFHFVSKGKPSGGGTIIYTYEDDVGTFKLADGDINLDFYSDGGFIYLPTEGNKTKESWEGVTELPEIKAMPSAIKALLKSLKKKMPTLASDTKPKTAIISNRLGPMVETFVLNGKYSPALFKVLTPHSFRDMQEYVTKGHLHPNDVPDGRGSEYLSKISAILGADISISIELYTNAMMLINSLWDSPMERGKLLATIVNPMIEGKAAIDGNPIWQYDEHWQLMGLVATALNGDYIESFFDDAKGLYYIVNYTANYIRTFSDKSAVIKTIKTMIGRPISEGAYDSTKQLIRTLTNPSLEFGHMTGTDNFNMFRQTPELKVITNPESYASQYSRPVHMINYFESLVPDDAMRAYLLSFLKTKLTTFAYSPVVLYFIGKPGSGKDTLVNILSQILGMHYVAKPDTKVFLEQYNGWLMDKYIVQLDEYGNKLTRSGDKQEVLGKIKAYTGSERLNIRAMHRDGFECMHSFTFIITANRNPLPVEVDDRRFAFFKTPNILANETWVVEAGGMSAVINKLKSEIMDFCYYLATEIDSLPMDSYTKAPETVEREELIISNLPAAEQIAYYIVNAKVQELYDLGIEHGVEGHLTDWWDYNRLTEKGLEALYDAMTDGQGQIKAVARVLKASGVKREMTTRNKMPCAFYYVEGLKNFDVVTNAHGFKPEDEDLKTITIAGLNG